jgi:hypothetical protein
MTKAIVLLVLLLSVSPPWGCEVVGQDPLATVMRPVKQLPVQPRLTEEISFEKFEFQQLIISRHPGMFGLEGEPTIGFRYFVEARIYGEEAIATGKFEAVDEAGRVIQKILIGRQPHAGGGSDFYGVMKVPDRPFRVVLSGEGIDGKNYRLTYERLFRPTTRPQSPVRDPAGRLPANARQRRQLLEVVQQQMDKLEEDVKKNAPEMIVLPRTRVSNVMYAQYLSKSGRPLGLRITYDVEFSHDGYYNPELLLFLDYKNVEWRGRITMTTLTGSIEPKPEEPGAPQDQPHVGYGAGYLYKAGTTYHFTAEYIPDFVNYNENRSKFCITYQKNKYSPEAEAAFSEILADNTPSPYSVQIRNTDFVGVIEGLPSQSELLKSFVADGAKECASQPN